MIFLSKCWSRRVAALVASTAVGALAACSGKVTPATGLVLTLRSDGSVSQANRMHIEIKSADGTTTYRDADYAIPAQTSLPTTLGISTDGNDVTSVLMNVSLYAGSTILDDRQHQIYDIPRDRLAELDIVFSAVCTPLAVVSGVDGASMCPNAQTCDPVAGGCVDNSIDATTLATYGTDGGTTVEPVKVVDGGSDGASVDDAGGSHDSGGSNDGATTGDADAGACGDGGSDCGDATTANLCGNGVLDPSEVCDPGSDVGTLHSGCAADCSAALKGYACHTAGMDCTKTSVCGNGVVEGTEQCDVGSGSALGCTSCMLTTITTVTPPSEYSLPTRVLTNYACSGTTCAATVCGNGHVEGTEECDDGNTRAFDGCSIDCQAEPRCPTGSCAPTCGDGVLEDFDANGDGKPDETCDDGNVLDGDGCSHACGVEPGYACVATANVATPTLDLPMVARDFFGASSGYGGDTVANASSYQHPDFETYRTNAVTPNMTAPTLSDGVPVPNAALTYGTSLTSARDFSDWFRDDILDPDGIGLTQPRGNRVDGEILQLTLVGSTYKFDSACDQPYAYGRTTSGDCLMSGNEPLGGFLPLEDLGWRDVEGISVGGPPVSVNLSFTTQLRYIFTYSASAPASPILTASSGDDLWIFLDGQRIVDLGGTNHPATTTTYMLSSAHAGSLGLVDGHPYEIDLFYAQRTAGASPSFALTLTGFSAVASVCTPR